MAQSIGAVAPRVRTPAVRAGSATGEQVADVQTRVCAALTAAIALTAAVGLVVVTGHHPRAATSPLGGAERPAASTEPAGSPAARAAAAWMARTLPHGAAVAAHGDVAGLLRAAGFRHVSPQDAGATYLVGGTATPGTVAIAGFGSSAAAVVVRQRVGARHPAGLWAADRAARRPAERELLGNYDVRTTPAARQTLATGAVDMRAATVVALLAGRGPVSVLAAVADPAERAAGLPVRTLDLRVDPGAAQDIRSGLSAAYQPQVVQNLPGGVERWTWPLRALPLSTATP